MRPGDTVDLIADRYNVTAYQIRRWNGLRSSKLMPGRTLRLYVEAQPTTTRAARSRAASKSRTRHATNRATLTQTRQAVAANHTIPPAALTAP